MGGRQPQVDALQLAHPGQGAVLDQALLEQAQAVGGAGPGGGAAEQPAAITAEARGHIDGHQGPWLLLVAPRQQAGQGRFGRAPLADAEKRIDPEGAIARIGFSLQLRNPQPAAVAQVGAREGFGTLKGGPEAHGHAGQVQLPGHHQAVPAVVAGPHQHEGRGWRRGEQPAGDRQGRLFHQGLHRQATGEELVFQRRHLAPRHQ